MTFVIADECHRGYTTAELSVCRNTQDGPDSNPAAHTTAYFKEVVFRYEYERAVREGYLVDFDLVALKSDVRIAGIFLKEGEKVGVVDTVSGVERMDMLEDEREFDASEVERNVTSPDSNRKILEEVNKYALEHQEEYGRFPKTRARGLRHRHQQQAAQLHPARDDHPQAGRPCRGCRPRQLPLRRSGG